MTFYHLILYLQEKLQQTLPGRQAHNLMISSDRHREFYPIPENAKKSSVLMLLYEKESDIKTVFIVRPAYDGVHSNQVSFPGGGFDSSDGSLEKTALRETTEEIGVDSNRIEIIGGLSELYIPPSNFLVKPFVGYTNDIGMLIPDQHEVERIVEIDVKNFIGTHNIKMRKIRLSSGLEFDTPYYDVANLVIWGATAMILREFGEVCSGIEL